MRASKQAANIVFLKESLSTIYLERQIRKWAKYWLKTETLPISYQGCHQKTIHIIDDENIAKRCKQWL